RASVRATRLYGAPEPVKIEMRSPRRHGDTAAINIKDIFMFSPCRRVAVASNSTFSHATQNRC
ncbi:MAG: hypothetical protein NT083_05100, partial [Rhodocyclales bacterium]|nr:hypothetical protein [Rhodocyclales bacterium]